MIYIGEVKNASGIYKITNTVNGKIYVGSSVNLGNRYREHKSYLNNGIHGNYHLQKSWDKYGEGNFSFSVIEVVIDKDMLLEREQYWMELHNVCDRSMGYNINPIAGSPLGRKISDEERKKRSLSRMRPILQFDTNGNLIKEWRGAKEMSNELNIKLKTIYYRIKNKTKLNNTYLIYKDEFTNEVLEIVLLGKERIGITSPSLYKKINQYDKNGIFIRTWDSIRLASKTLIIQRSSIIKCCKEKSKSAGGFIWSYVD